MQFSLRQYVCKTSWIDFGFTLCSQQTLARERGERWRRCQQWDRVRSPLHHSWNDHHVEERAAQFHSEKPKVVAGANNWSTSQLLFWRKHFGISLISWSGYPARKINWWTQLTDPLACFDFHVCLVFTFKCCQFVCCKICSQQPVFVFVRLFFNTDFFRWFLTHIIETLDHFHKERYLLTGTTFTCFPFTCCRHHVPVHML